MTKTTFCCWGNSDYGQLGLGSSETEQVYEPVELAFFSQNQLEVVQVASGRFHTLVVLSDGSLWSFGSNENGQLGRDLSGWRRPGRIEGVKNHNIIQAAVGSCHSLALSDGGQVFSWGSNECGQCGRESDEEGLRVPKYTAPFVLLVKHLAHEFIIQITAGVDFCLALSDTGDVFVWGRNSSGQLGLGHVELVTVPTVLKSLQGLPVKQIAAGGAYSIILSKSGAAFASGKNDFGQLGLGDMTDRMYPTSIKSFKNQRVCYVACGQEHTAALTFDGGVFTFGAGGMGQLGHGGVGTEVNPRKVFELMGSQVSQICCGRYHTMAYVSNSNKVYGFGLSGSGQLGVKVVANCVHPILCRGPWLIHNSTPPTVALRELFGGGDQTFAIVSQLMEKIPPVDFRRERPLQLVPSLTLPVVHRFVNALQQLPDEDSLLDESTNRDLELLCGSVSCWNGSFMGPGEEHFSCGLRSSGIDFAQAWSTLQLLASACKTRTRESITDQIRRKLLPSLSNNPADIECLRVYMLLPLFPVFAFPLDPEKVMKDIVPLASAMKQLNNEAVKVLKSWLSVIGVHIFEHFVQLYKSCVVVILTMPKIGELIQKDPLYLKGTKFLLEALSLLFDTNNRLRTPSNPIAYETFYIPEITAKVDIGNDYKNWSFFNETHRHVELSFCNYPFTFDPSAKTILLQADSNLQMEKAVNSMNHMDYLNNFIRAAAIGQGHGLHPQQVVFLNLYVSRNDLLKDALDQIWRLTTVELKRPLKVWFIGEEAEDAGGVKKEFFMLLMRELLDPKYGMFTYYEETHALYFNGSSFECASMFGIVGIICGLAIYNSIIVDVHFPLVVYKKLLRIPPGLSDLEGLMPTVKRSLEQMLQYEDSDFESVFSLNFTITREYLGETIVTELKPNGAEISVTKDNRQEYVNLYVDFILNKSVQNQFKAFSAGFDRVCGGRILELFHPQELMAMVCGNENYDWKELEAAAVYKGEYSADHPTIKLFWKVFHSLDVKEKKRFLLFLTGCDRIPILGMKAVRIIIQPAGGGDKYLPVAHTCFNILDLPKYRDEETLRDKLRFAVDHTQGFGLA